MGEAKIRHDRLAAEAEAMGPENVRRRDETQYELQRIQSFISYCAQTNQLMTLFAEGYSQTLLTTAETKALMDMIYEKKEITKEEVLERTIKNLRERIQVIEEMAGILIDGKGVQVVRQDDPAGGH